MKPPGHYLRIVLIALVAGTTGPQALAQDGHYWTEQFGTRSMVLSGVVIGSVEDLGAVFYNPARLTQTDNPSFLLSGKVYQLNKIKIIDGAGDNFDLKRSQFGGAPSLVAGTFNLNFLPGHTFAYSFLPRFNFGADFFVHTETLGDIVELWPGEELYSGQFHFDKELKEDWLGLSWAHALNENWSIGISNFVALRHQAEKLETELQILSEDNEVAMLRTSREMGYKSTGILWKLAWAFEKNNFSTGMAITTPKVSIGGNGSTGLQEFYSGPKGVGGGKLKDVFIDDFQDNLSARHRSPWAIGWGAGYRIGKSQIHLSAEWFSGVQRYTLVQSDSFIGESNGRTYLVQMVDELNPVINFGAGFESWLSPTFSAFASFATDYSAVMPNTYQYIENSAEANGSMIQADMFHLGGGVIANTRWFELTAGIAYAYAHQAIKRPFQFPEDEGDLVAHPENDATIQLRRYKFILGFSLPLTKKKD